MTLWMGSLCDTGSTAMAPLLCIPWGRTAKTEEEIHQRRIPTKSSRLNLPGQGMIGSGPGQWLPPKPVQVDARLAVHQVPVLAHVQFSPQPP